MARTRNRDGIVIRDQWTRKRQEKGTRWLYRVWDPIRRRYINEAFDPSEEDEGRRLPGCNAGVGWAKDTAAKVRLGLQQASNAKLADLGKLYTDRMRNLERSARGIENVQMAIDRALGAGITDLSDPAVPDRTQYWLAKLTSLRGNQRKPRATCARTKNAYLNCLRSIANFAVRRRLLAFNPFLACEHFCEAKRFRRVYSIDELRKIVSDKHRDHPWWLFAVLAAYTGLRSSTLWQLTWDMVDWNANRIRVPAEITKTRSDVRVPIQPELLEILKDEAGVGKRPITQRVRACTTSDQAHDETQKYLQHVGVEPNGRSVHCFRHSVVSLLTATGLPPFLVMDAVGHSATATSKHYARGSDEFREQIRKEKWPEGEFFLRRDPSRVELGKGLEHAARSS